MRKFKMVALLMSMVLLICSAFSMVFAEDGSTVSGDISVAPRMTCQHCGGDAVSVCTRESILLGDAYHYGWSGLSLVNCHWYGYGCEGYELCRDCHKIVEEYGIHDCYEVHINCSKDLYDICPMQVH